MFCEKLLGYFCNKDLRKFCWWFCPGWRQSGSPELSLLAVLEIAEVQGNAEICRRFVGGSGRNRALLGNPGNRCTVCKSRNAA